jgi:hypothetical protein
MLQKIAKRYGVAEMLEAQVAEAEQMIERYGWQKMTIAPYGHAEPLMRYIEWMKDYRNCTDGSKDTLIAVWNGMADVLNAWEQSAKERTVRVTILSGRHEGEERMLSPWMAEMLLEEGAVRLA